MRSLVRTHEKTWCISAGSNWTTLTKEILTSRLIISIQNPWCSNSEVQYTSLELCNASCRHQTWIINVFLKVPVPEATFCCIFYVSIVIEHGSRMEEQLEMCISPQCQEPQQGLSTPVLKENAHSQQIRLCLVNLLLWKDGLRRKR